jgi:hypothetical protein
MYRILNPGVPSPSGLEASAANAETPDEKMAEPPISDGNNDANDESNDPSDGDDDDESEQDSKRKKKRQRCRFWMRMTFWYRCPRQINKSIIENVCYRSLVTNVDRHKRQNDWEQQKILPWLQPTKWTKTRTTTLTRWREFLYP